LSREFLFGNFIWIFFNKTLNKFDVNWFERVRRPVGKSSCPQPVRGRNCGLGQAGSAELNTLALYLSVVGAPVRRASVVPVQRRLSLLGIGAPLDAVCRAAYLLEGHQALA
jgi:hypothetical protein